MWSRFWPRTYVVTMLHLSRTIVLSVSVVMAATSAASADATTGPADRVYRNGVIFTADANQSSAEAIAIRNGRIIYVGGNDGLGRYIGAATINVDLKGRFLMPGLIDGHMHPLEAGATLLKCNLHYESLTVTEFQRRVQACLDQTKSEEPDGWLEVVSWFQESMRPAGVKTNRAMLDSLETSRPIIVRAATVRDTTVLPQRPVLRDVAVVAD